MNILQKIAGRKQRRSILFFLGVFFCGAVFFLNGPVNQIANAQDFTPINQQPTINDCLNNPSLSGCESVGTSPNQNPVSEDCSRYTNDQDFVDCLNRDQDARDADEAAMAANIAASDTSINFGKLASMLVSIFTPLIAILVNFIGKLMGTEVVYGAFAGSDGAAFEEVLYVVWLVMRDIVNYCFILVLLIIAFMAVFGSAGEGVINFELKKILPKFIIAVVCVNFTWFGAKVVLDVANVTTHIVFAIPKSLGLGAEDYSNVEQACKKGDEAEAEDKEELKSNGCIPLSVFVKNETSTKGFSAGARLGRIEDNALPENFFQNERYRKEVQYMENIRSSDKAAYIEDFGRFVVIWGDFNWDRFQGNTIAALFAYNVLQIQNLPRSIRDINGNGVGIEDIIINAGFALVMMIIVIVAFVVMFVVLLERIIVIWINIVVSPLGCILFVVKDIGLDGSFGEEAGIGFKRFITAAFLPALMGIPLMLGYILILAGMTIVAGTPSSPGEVIILEKELINGVSTMHHLLWYVLAVGVLWSSTSIAEKLAVFTGGIVQGVTGKVKEVGGFIGKLPLYGQFIPIGTESKDGEPPPMASLAGLGALYRNLKLSIERTPDEQAQKLAKHFGMDTGDSNRFNEMKSFIERQTESSLHTATDKLADLVKNEKIANMEQLSRSIDTKPEIKKLLGVDRYSDIRPAEMTNILQHLEQHAKVKGHPFDSSLKSLLQASAVPAAAIPVQGGASTSAQDGQSASAAGEQTPDTGVQAGSGGGQQPEVGEGADEGGGQSGGTGGEQSSGSEGQQSAGQTGGGTATP